MLRFKTDKELFASMGIDVDDTSCKDKEYPDKHFSCAYAELRERYGTADIRQMLHLYYENTWDLVPGDTVYFLDEFADIMGDAYATQTRDRDPSVVRDIAFKFPCYRWCQEFSAITKDMYKHFFLHKVAGSACAIPTEVFEYADCPNNAAYALCDKNGDVYYVVPKGEYSIGEPVLSSESATGLDTDDIVCYYDWDVIQHGADYTGKAVELVPVNNPLGEQFRLNPKHWRESLVKNPYYISPCMSVVVSNDTSNNPISVAANIPEDLVIWG